MSILIKGMEMPKSCDSCDLIQFDDEELEAHCPLSPYYRWCGTPPDYRPEGCPLVEIPTPHGRLIDADRLLESIKTNFYEHFGNYDSGQELLFDLICNSIEDSLTIIEAEVSEE